MNAFPCRFRNPAPISRESRASASARHSRWRKKCRGIAASSRTSTPTSSTICGVAEDPDPRQGNAAQALACRVARSVLRVPVHRDRRILALGRLDRSTRVLPAHPGRPTLCRAFLGTFISLHRHRPGRSLPHLVSARRASGRPGLGAQRADVRRWDGLGRRRQSYPSAGQLDLIQTLRPTVFIGMSSFALHLANLAEAKGIDLAAGRRCASSSARPRRYQPQSAKSSRACGARRSSMCSA